MTELPLEVGAIVDTDNGFTRLRVAELTPDPFDPEGITMARLTYGGHDVGLYSNSTWPDWRLTVTTAAALAPPETPFSGWMLRTRWRDRMLEQLAEQGIEPQHRHLDAHHVTDQYPAEERTVIGWERLSAVAYIDGPGVDLLVVEVTNLGKPTTRRPDGGTYHMTLSLDIGHEAVEANDLLGRTDPQNWQRLRSPITLESPTVF